MAIDFQNELLLVTAASGKQASALLPHIAPQWKRLRLQCVSDASRERLQQEHPSAEVVQTGFDTQEKANALLDGVSACFLILPGFHPRETQHGINIIEAARARGDAFKHLVFSSVIHTSIRAMANHDDKRYVEEALVESGLPYTTVQPTHLMDVVPIAKLVKDAGNGDIVFPAVFNPNTKFSFLSCHDLGEATAKILLDREKHMYATYQFVGTKVPMSYVEAMNLVESVVGKKVKIERARLEETAAKLAKESGLEGKDVQAAERKVARMLVYYGSVGLVGNPNVLEFVLGRGPLGYKEWVEMKLRK